MSAKMKTFFELQKAVDHDCGLYQIGEIDFVNYDHIREYIASHEELGYRSLIDVCIKIMSVAQDQIIIERNKRQPSGSQEKSV